MLSRKKRNVYNKQKNIKSRRTYKRRKRSKTKRRRRSKYSGGANTNNNAGKKKISKKVLNRRKKRKEKLSRDIEERERWMALERERLRNYRLFRSQADAAAAWHNDGYGTPPDSDQGGPAPAPAQAAPAQAAPAQAAPAPAQAAQAPLQEPETDVE